MLCQITGYTPPWGILTGVRPAKLMSKLISQYGVEGAKEYFCDELGASTGKNVCALATDLAKYNEMSIAKLFMIYGGSK